MMSGIFEPLLCVFLIICFNGDPKILKQCPNYCHCFNGGHTYRNGLTINQNQLESSTISIRCNNFSETMSQELSEVSIKYHINTLAFEEITADSFPNNIFQSLSFDNLIISASDIKQISNQKLLAVDMFENKSQSQGITILDSDISEWNWYSDFSMFNSIQVIYIEASILPEVNSFHYWSNNSVTSLSLIDCGIISIHENEFDHWPNLTIVSLSKNYINILYRNWFASELNVLWSLDLSYNKIITISQDFFTGMPALRKLRLDNNKIIELSQDTLKPIWNNGVLHELYIESNNITCGRRNDLCWIAAEIDNSNSIPMFFEDGECIDITNDTIKYFYELIPSEVCKLKF